MSLTELNKVNLPFGSIAYTKEGIVVIDFNDDIELQIEDTETIANAVISLTGKKLSPTLILTGERNSITPEARDHELKKFNLSLADAIVVTSLPTRIMTMFFIKFNPPNHPYKIFGDKEQAIQWLHSFVSKEPAMAEN